jgi:hypothetical protein
VNTSEVIEQGGLKALVDVVNDAYQQKAKIKALRLINNFLSGMISFWDVFERFYESPTKNLYFCS